MMPPFIWACATLLAWAPSLQTPLGGPHHHDFERLVALAGVPAASKPYPDTLLISYAGKIANEDPDLYRRVMRTLAPSKRAVALKSLTIEAGAHHEPSSLALPMPNERGRTTDGALFASARAVARLGRYAAASCDAAILRRDDEYRVDVPNTHLSVGWPALQLDVGYRDRWLSPADEGAVVFSTNAPASFSVGVRNTLPLTRARIFYEAFYTRLSTSHRIVFDERFTTGRPQFLGLHLSFAPLDWLVLGANRAMQYGGGPRDPVGIDEILRALVFPNRYDNRGSALDPDDEFGNQVGSISVSADYRIASLPLRVYWEMGADDTGSHRIYYFGNAFATAGIFFPRLTRNTSLRYEFSEGQNRWYEHALYQDGYRNEDRILGHWIYEANRERWGFETEAQLHALRWVRTTDAREWAATVRLVSARSFSGIEFHQGWEADLRARERLRGRFSGFARLYGGRTTRDESFALFTVGVSYE